MTTGRGMSLFIAARVLQRVAAGRIGVDQDHVRLEFSTGGQVVGAGQDGGHLVTGEASPAQISPAGLIHQ